MDQISDRRGETVRLTPLDLGITWDPQSPRPTLLQSGSSAVLIFYLPDKTEWTAAPCFQTAEELAVLEFTGCAAVRFGASREPSGGAYEVVESAWRARLIRQVELDPHHHPRGWTAKRHYILCFPDSTFECVAEAFRIKTTTDPLPTVLGSVGRLLSHDNQP